MSAENPGMLLEERAGGVASGNEAQGRSIDGTLVLVLFVGLLIRLLYVSFAPQQEVSHDAAVYERIATDVVSSGKYPRDAVAYTRPPLYPFLLAGAYRLSAWGNVTVRQLQALLFSFTAVISYVIALRLFDQRVARASALLVSFYPGFIGYSGLLLTEALFSFLVALGTLLVVKAIQMERAVWSVLAGVVFGLGSLCRSELIAFPFFLMGALVLMDRRVAGRHFRAAMIAVAMVLTVLPWTARNYVRFGHIVPVAGGAGATVWLSTYPEDWTEWHADKEPLRSLLAGNGTPQALDRKLLRAGLANIRAYPVAYVQMSAKRFWRFWIGSHSNTIKGLEESFGAALAQAHYGVLVAKGALLVINMSLLGFAVLGFCLERRRWSRFWPVALVIVYVNLLHTVLFSTPRYQIPIMPLVLIFSAVGMTRPWHLVPGGFGGLPGAWWRAR